ncbi:Transglutaminase-like enzyme, putative cysteine protease [Methylobacterium sp. 174MFSha1.1]|uniref:transglutaminase family protein n=1 Tax=Methylobacterium sp. 174MFSha1.1 TaxID=1502749 RepID=UPI0008E0C275|nr:transglutaminase family protein [Methylobacterium sp. 174MFSha1.1]SFU88112.1 Transglutaminase-like enzyme, putative cysteine protease [Methylobacterium sp. 174MFSha1.1]
MRIRVVHETVYQYDSPARGLIQMLRLTPRDHDGQHVRAWRIEPTVDGRLSRREDGFGNIVHVFSADGPEEALTIRATGEIETAETHGVMRGISEWLPDPFYLRESRFAVADEAIRAFADEAVGAATNRLDQLHRLLAAVHESVDYAPGPTGAATTAAEAFGLRKGVGQDLAHVFIAAARHLEIPVRYVSGYCWQPDMADREAGHAWVEARVPDLGWVGFDPAHGIAVTEAHLRVAIGLDYLDAAPVRGSRTGGGTETMTVRVRVEDARAQAQAPQKVKVQAQDQVRDQVQAQG